ncbi:hypothetical protein PHLCEN_2v13150 [Hermanssonia centrifuga]|uniref:Uncharacterized protein n=1 Tax=Hermanssonia centrifuga TaxID=98765 RepID=A0A2R6NF11_9APHY|nr:hypothetical protein PHLCEN_2v13150 [Hermanssonia centrifuga]
MRKVAAREIAAHIEKPTLDDFKDATPELLPLLPPDDEEVVGEFPEPKETVDCVSRL